MIILTIDTDWAPEEAVRATLDKIRALGVKTTVFFSQPSPVPPWPLMEVGAHPDLSRRQVPADGGGELDMASEAHDRDVLAAEAAILNGYRRALPEAEAVRTHRFYWHSDLAGVMSRAGFRHDSSMILPYQPGLKGFRTGRLTRWPVWASDHLHLARGFPLDRLNLPYLDRPGLKIFCFHVAYLHLNVRNLAEFNMVRTRLTATAGQSTTERSSTERSTTGRPGGGPGVWNLFELLAERLYKNSGGLWLKELGEDWLLKNQTLDCGEEENENNGS